MLCPRDCPMMKPSSSGCAIEWSFLKEHRRKWFSGIEYPSPCYGIFLYLYIGGLGPWTRYYSIVRIRIWHWVTGVPMSPKARSSRASAAGHPPAKIHSKLEEESDITKAYSRGEVLTDTLFFLPNLIRKINFIRFHQLQRTRWIPLLLWSWFSYQTSVKR